MTRRTAVPDPAEVYVHRPRETCTHAHTELVYAVLARGTDGERYLNDGAPLFRMCTHCTAVLPVEHGCTECEWVEERRFCDTVPYLLLARPCEEHAR